MYTIFNDFSKYSVAGSEDDGGDQPDGGAAAADSWQDSRAAGQESRWSDQLWGVLWYHCQGRWRYF